MNFLSVYKGQNNWQSLLANPVVICQGRVPRLLSIKDLHSQGLNLDLLSMIPGQKLLHRSCNVRQAFGKLILCTGNNIFLKMEPIQIEKFADLAQCLLIFKKHKRIYATISGHSVLNAVNLIYHLGRFIYLHLCFLGLIHLLQFVTIVLDLYMRRLCWITMDCITKRNVHRIPNLIF